MKEKIQAIIDDLLELRDSRNYRVEETKTTYTSFKPHFFTLLSSVLELAEEVKRLKDKLDAEKENLNRLAAATAGSNEDINNW